MMELANIVPTERWGVFQLKLGDFTRREGPTVPTRRELLDPGAPSEGWSEVEVLFPRTQSDAKVSGVSPLPQLKCPLRNILRNA